MKANLEKRSDHELVWFGFIEDISQKINHLKLLEKMVFAISHGIRRPIANSIGVGQFLKLLK
jgi:hypothetical protein